MTNNPARFLFFAGYLSYYVFFLCLLSKTYFSVLPLSVDVLLPKWKFFFEFIICHVHWMLIFRFACKKFSRMMLLLFSEFFLRFPTFYRHFYDKVNFIFGASRWRTLIFVLLLTSGVTVLYSTISTHLFCVNSFYHFPRYFMLHPLYRTFLYYSIDIFYFLLSYFIPLTFLMKNIFFLHL